MKGLKKPEATPAADEHLERKPGRPPGSENKDYDVVTVEPTRCLGCQSTEREAYFRTTVQPFAGVDPSGRPYTHVVRRYTRCAGCGQLRIDRSLENRTGGEGLAEGEIEL